MSSGAVIAVALAALIAGAASGMLAGYLLAQRRAGRVEKFGRAILDVVVAGLAIDDRKKIRLGSETQRAGLQKIGRGDAKVQIAGRRAFHHARITRGEA